MSKESMILLGGMLVASIIGTTVAVKFIVPKLK
jgi:hypothetical protein